MVNQSKIELIVEAARFVNPMRQARKATDALVKAQSRLAGVQKRVAVRSRRLARDLEKQTRGIREQTRGVRGLVAAYAGFRSLQGSIGLAVELESAEKRAELLVKRFGQLSGIQQVAAQSANKFRLTQTATLKSLIDLGNRLGPQGASLAEIRDVYEGFNTVLAINKVGTQEAAAAQLQLNQALGSGRLAGDEFRSVNEATPQVIDAVAKILGVARGEVKALAAEGKVSAPVLIQALRNIKAQGAEELEASFNSTAGRLREFQKAQRELGQAIGKELLPAFTPLLRALTNAIRNFLDLPGPIKTVVAGVAGFTTALVTLAPALTGTIKLLKLLGAAKLIAAGPWVALGAGVAALGVALYQSATAADRFRQDLEKGNKTVTEGEQKLEEYNKRLDDLDKRLKKTTNNRIRASLARQISDISKNKQALIEVLEALKDANETGGSGGLSGGGGGKPDKAAADRLKQLQKQTSDYLFAAQNRLKIEQESDALERIRIEAAVRRAEIERNYQDTIRGVTDATVLKNAADARSAELALTSIQLGKELGDELDSQSEKLRTLKQRYGDAAIGAQQFAAVKNPVEQLGKAIGVTKSEFSQLASEVVRGTATIGDAFQRLADQVIDSLIRIAVQQAVTGLIGMVASVFSPFSSVGSNLSGKGALATSGSGLSVGTSSAAGIGYGGGVGNPLSGMGSVGGGNFSGFQGSFAKGGRVVGGKAAIVGERGPELFVPGRSGSIVPNGAMGGVQVGSVNITVENKGERLSPAAQKEIAKEVQSIVMATLVNERRSGGILG